jgi:putative ABC transport system permease protein
MGVIIRMAFRNLLEHKSKSLIVGILLALGVVILIVGNSFIDASAAGIRITFTDSYTGDVFISGTSPSGKVSLFGVQSVGGLDATPNIPDYEKVRAKAATLSGVKGVTSLATGFGMAIKDAEQSAMDSAADGSSDSDPGAGFLFMFGVDAKDYWNVFDSVDITSGQRLAPGQTGIILYEKHMKKMSKKLGKELKIGDSILVQGFSSGGMRLREIPIVGTYMQKGDSASPEQMAFVDIDSLRVLSSMTVGSDENITLTKTQTAMLETTDTDSLFGSDMVENVAPATKSFDEKSLSSLLGDKSIREKLNAIDLGAWQFMLIRTQKPQDAARVAKALNVWLASEKIDAEAGDWQKAAGPYGQSVDVVRIVFNIAIIILAIVAIIIITNTLVISVIERTGEIGTMRAIGAGRSFVRRLFATETFVLSLVFGLVGVLLAIVTVATLRSLHIEAGNPFLEVLFGGKYLNPSVSFGTILGSLAGIIAVGYLAHLYPVSVALKIQPVRAMQSE